VSAPPQSAEVGPVTVARSTGYRFQSKIVDDVYEVRVAVPEDYDNDQEFPPSSTRSTASGISVC
jgi:hypothetical protein